MTNRAVGTGFGVLLALFVAMLGAQAGDDLGAQSKPNIVLINLDDADMDLLSDEALAQYFPNIKRHIADAGTRFENFHVVAPLCGPSRGSVFRGQYPHNTGIVRNQLGWEIFYDRGYTDDEIGMWMREAGYHTTLVGKYCHEEYPTASNDNGYVPPGWDRFHASLGGKYFRTLRNVDGRRTTNDVSAYRTDVERASVRETINIHDSSQPMFLYVAPFAPHGTADPRGMVAPRFRNAFPNATIPRTPDFDEADVSDKTPQYQALPRFGDGAGAKYDWRFRDRIRAMLAVDQMVGEIFEGLERRGMLDNTYVMLTSDNGFQIGHHRALFKKDPFDRVTRVQLLVRGPGVPAGETASHLLGHIDLAPTLLDLAGSEAPLFVDGKSFASLLTAPSASNPREWRDALLIENVEGKAVNGVELDTEYVALRRFDDVYVEWANGDREYYDLAADPFQLENAWSTLTSTERTQLASQLQQLRNCAGPSCDGGSPPPAVDTTAFAGEDRRLPLDLALGGVATAQLGVDRVEVVVRRVEDRTYWNGERFQPEYLALAARLDEPGRSQSRWGLDVQLTEGAEYWMSARAVDGEGNKDTTAVTGFFTAARDSSAPSVVGTELTSEPDSSIVIRGSAIDDRAVSHVRLRIRSQRDGSWWNGSTFQRDETFMTVNIAESFAPESSWSSSAIGLPPGEYEIEAIAVDGARRTSAPATLFADVNAVCNGEDVTILGTVDDDILVGTDGDDVIHGLSGDDQIDGRAGDDVICGGPGSDVITGGPGRDRIFGNGGADILSGDSPQ